MPIHRTLKNVVKNYTPAEVKVREATSNDPWGPTTSLMNEIAEMTNSPEQLAEVMGMVWKRLQDVGKNWRHVFKALSLLDYLTKTANERVAEQCKSYLYLLQSLTEFKHFEEGKDCGSCIREKAKQLVILLKDSEKFKVERTKALSAKEKMSRSTGIGSTTRKMTHSISEKFLYSSSLIPDRLKLKNPELESARPSNFGEEDLQLQLALAMSKEEHEEELKRRKGDEFKLQLALEESKKVEAENIVQPLNSPSSDKTSRSQQISQSATWDGQLFVQPSSDPWSPPVTILQQNQQNNLFGSPNHMTTNLNSNPNALSVCTNSFGSNNSNPYAFYNTGPSSNLSVFPPSVFNHIANSLPTNNYLGSNFGSTASNAWGGRNNNASNAGVIYTPIEKDNKQPIMNDPWGEAGFISDVTKGSGLGAASAFGGIVPTNINASPWDEFLLPAQNMNKTALVDQVDNEFDQLSSRFKSVEQEKKEKLNISGMGDKSKEDIFGLFGDSQALSDTWNRGNTENGAGVKEKKIKSVEDFLGPNANLVNLKELVTKPPPSNVINPFAMTSNFPKKLTTNSPQSVSIIQTTFAMANNPIGWPPVANQGIAPLHGMGYTNNQQGIQLQMQQPFISANNYPQSNNPFL